MGKRVWFKYKRFVEVEKEKGRVIEDPIAKVGLGGDCRREGVAPDQKKKGKGRVGVMCCGGGAKGQKKGSQDEYRRQSCLDCGGKVDQGCVLASSGMGEGR